MVVNKKVEEEKDKDKPFKLDIKQYFVRIIILCIIFASIGLLYNYFPFIPMLESTQLWDPKVVICILAYLLIQIIIIIVFSYTDAKDVKDSELIFTIVSVIIAGITTVLSIFFYTSGTPDQTKYGDLGVYIEMYKHLYDKISSPKNNKNNTQPIPKFQINGKETKDPEKIIKSLIENKDNLEQVKLLNKKPKEFFMGFPLDSALMKLATFNGVGTYNAPVGGGTISILDLLLGILDHVMLIRILTNEDNKAKRFACVNKYQEDTNKFVQELIFNIGDECIPKKLLYYAQQGLTWIFTSLFALFFAPIYLFRTLFKVQEERTNELGGDEPCPSSKASSIFKIVLKVAVIGFVLWNAFTRMTVFTPNKFVEGFPLTSKDTWENWRFYVFVIIAAGITGFGSYMFLQNSGSLMESVPILNYTRIRSFIKHFGAFWTILLTFLGFYLIATMWGITFIGKDITLSIAFTFITVGAIVLAYLSRSTLSESFLR
jgi:hypothetical protein